MKVMGHDLEVIIRHRPIKNIYLRLLNAQVLLVTCPDGTSEAYIYKLIEEKEKWIVESILNISRSKKGFHDPIYYLGKRYKLSIRDGHSKVAIRDDEIVVYAPKGDEKKARQVFYAHAAKVLDHEIGRFKDRYLSILKDHGYRQEPVIRYRLVKSRWGVCYSDRNIIELNELLVHYEPKCLEAVFWHECVHFLLPNHSKRFHELLELYMPDYKEIHKSLR